jgi:hypothetical protein
MGNITGGVTVSADGKCRDFAFGVLTSSGQRALLLSRASILNPVSSLAFASIFFFLFFGFAYYLHKPINGFFATDDCPNESDEW